MRNFENTVLIWVVVPLALGLRVGIGGGYWWYKSNQKLERELTEAQTKKSELEKRVDQWKTTFQDSLSKKTGELAGELQLLQDSLGRQQAAHNALLEVKDSDIREERANNTKLKKELAWAIKQTNRKVGTNPKEMLETLRLVLNAMKGPGVHFTPSQSREMEGFESELKQMLKPYRKAATTPSNNTNSSKGTNAAKRKSKRT